MWCYQAVRICISESTNASKCNWWISVFTRLTFQTQHFLWYGLCSRLGHLSPTRVYWFYSSLSYSSYSIWKYLVVCRRISLSETSTFLATTAVTHSGHNLDHLPVTVHMIFDFVQLLRNVLSLDRKGKTRELQSYLAVQYRSSKKSNLKRKEKIAKCYHKTCKVLFLKIVLPRKHTSTYKMRYFVMCLRTHTLNQLRWKAILRSQLSLWCVETCTTTSQHGH